MSNKTNLTITNLCNNLTDSDSLYLSQCGILRTFQKGDLIINEGEHAKSIFLIIDGQLSVNQGPNEAYPQNDKLSYLGETTVATLTRGSLFGESALYNEGTRVANIKAESNGYVVEFSIQDIEKNPDLHRRLLKYTMNSLTLKLKSSNAILYESMKKELDSSKRRVGLATFTIYSIWTISLYTIFSKMTSHVEKTSNDLTAITFIALALLTITMGIYIKRSELPLKAFGITLHRAIPNCIEGFVIGIFVVLIYKASLNYIFVDDMLVGTNDNITLGVFLYTCHAALQELLFRGGLLAGFYHFLPGSKFKRGFDSILITNALFMATHTHLSIFFSLVAFVLGLIWGLLFLKQESLVGPIVAHIIIGNMTMFYFGLPHYFL